MVCEVPDVLFYLSLIVIVYLVVEYFRRKPQINNIFSKSILVTGCDTGFGNKLAKRLDGLECRVFAGCYTQKGVDELRSCSSPRVETFLLDVTKTESIKKALAFVKDRLPPDDGLWGLVNNAGIVGSVLGPPDLLTRDDLQGVLDVNLLGMMDMTVHFLPLIMRARGRIVNMSSVGGRLSLDHNNMTYYISKYGVEAMTDGLRPHMKKYGCHVAAIEPSYYATNITGLDLTHSRIQRAYDRMSSDDQGIVGSDYVDKAFAVRKNMAKLQNKNLDEVVDAYQHALFAVNPKKRYSCGWEARYFFIPLSYMPSWLQDFLLPRRTQIFRFLI